MKEDPYEGINDFYRKNPPEFVIDDLGIYHDCEVPLPAKCRRCPCKCGIIHKWENPETFYVKDSLMYNTFIKKVKFCKSCDEILMLELVGKYGT
jgi:hypothetical protein